MDRCKLGTTETKNVNDLNHVNDIILKSGIELTRSAVISDEFKKGNTTIPPTINNENNFTIFETTTTVYGVLLAAITIETTTTTIVPTTTTTTTILTSTANAKTITETVIEENDSINSADDAMSITTTTTTITTTTTTATTTIATTSATNIISIKDIHLPSRTILQSFEDETLLWWINLKKILEKKIPTFHDITEAFDNKSNISISNPQKSINDDNNESKLRYLEEIVRELRENPNKYKVSVERVDDRQSWIVIRIGNYHKRENLHETIFTDIPGMLHQFPTRRDSPEELKANYHILRIKLPYEFLNNNSNTLKGSEIQQNEARTNPESISGFDRQRLNKQKEDGIFEKVPAQFIDKQHGYLYHVQIHGINQNLSSVNDHEMRQKKIKSSKIATTDDNINGRKTSLIINSTCFGMIDRQLLYNASYKEIDNISLEQCRCACAKTWNNDDKNDCMIKCKSFQYSNVTRKCLLNEDDHHGNYDLIYNWDNNYFYRICTTEDIISNANRNCHTERNTNFVQFALEGTSANEDVMISSSSGSSADENKTNHSNRKRSTIDHRSVFSSSAFRTKSVYWWKEHGKEEVSNKTISEEVILSPDLWSKIMKTKSVAKNFKSLVLEILEKQSEEISAEKSEYDYKIKIQHGTTTASTTTTTTDTVTTNIISHGSRGIRSTSDTDLEIIEKPFATTKIFTDYTKMIITNLSSSSSSSTTSEEIVKSLTNESELKVIGTIEHEIRTDNGNNKKFRGSINELNSSIEKLATTAIIGQQATTDKDLEDERFDGTSDDNLNENEITTVAAMVTEGSGEMITNKKLDIPEKNSREDANKIEQNLASKPVGDCFEVIDGFILKGTAGGLEQDVTLEECQCYCANSRSDERYSFQCVSATYYHNERDCILNLQTRNDSPDQFQLQDNVSYLGMICSVEESKERLVNNNFVHGCRQTASISTSTTIPEKIFMPVNTDSCFVEMPNHVLHGTAFAAETNVSVDACKCYCMNAENRYGIECNSIEYYFDSRTCLLSNLSRITDPKNFNHSIVYTLMHSYFDKSCLTGSDKFPIYMKENCLSTMNLVLKDENLSLNFRAENDNNRNITLHNEETKNIYDSSDNIDLSSSSMISSTNPSHSIQYTTPQSTYYDPSEDVGEGKKTKENESQNHDLTTTYVKTTMSTNDFTTVSDSFTEHSDTTATIFTTTQTEMDYTISNETLETTSPVEIIKYSHHGKCIYSAIYQTSFHGAKLIKRFLVSSPQQCFYGCHFEGCRSSNLLQVDNQTYSCELFSDALIDYRTADVLVYDSGSVYFDGIKCTMKRPKVVKSSDSESNRSSADNEDYGDNN
ncbi:Uncharacterized protein BM_BM11665 [Brugia malayi]|uniref:Apple domain-containing protein n=1 Tax=Brugia malayi TaxID=6279 RepID=A0A4E9F3H5_BRUMA|nr:Uncharacterized protein BM_BM11665 [Brugia malayi]VIO89738.1 Uncharacterized protein BM_BM11665 [Brugia malayi]